MYGQNGRVSIYQCIINKAYMTHAITAEEYFIPAKLHESDGVTKQSDNVYRLTLKAGGVPTVAHPIYSPKADAVLIDGRAYLDRNGMPKSEELRHLAARGELEYHWHTEGDDYKIISAPLAAVFGNWVSSSLVRNFNLDAGQGAQISLIFATYYYALMHTGAEIKSKGYDGFSADVVKKFDRNLFLNKEQVRNFVETDLFELYFGRVVNASSSSSELLKAALWLMSELIDLKQMKFTEVSFITVMSRMGWLGSSEAQRIAGTCIEHPPTLAWMIHRISQSSLYRNTGVGKIVDRVKRVAGTDHVVKFVKEVI